MNFEDMFKAMELAERNHRIEGELQIALAGLNAISTAIDTPPALRFWEALRNGAGMLYLAGEVVP